MDNWDCKRCLSYEWGCEWRSQYGDGSKGRCPDYREDPDYVEKTIQKEVARQLRERGIV